MTISKHAQRPSIHLSLGQPDSHRAARGPTPILRRVSSRLLHLRRITSRSSPYRRAAVYNPRHLPSLSPYPVSSPLRFRRGSPSNHFKTPQTCLKQFQNVKLSLASSPRPPPNNAGAPRRRPAAAIPAPAGGPLRQQWRSTSPSWDRWPARPGPKP